MSARTWLRLLRGGSVSSTSLSKRIAPTRLPPRVSSRAKVVASSHEDELLRPVDRPEPHRRRAVEQQPRGELAVLGVLADERRVHPRGHVPVDVADVVAGLVLAQVGEVEARSRGRACGSCPAAGRRDGGSPATRAGAAAAPASTRAESRGAPSVASEVTVPPRGHALSAARARGRGRPRGCGRERRRRSRRRRAPRRRARAGAAARRARARAGPAAARSRGRGRTRAPGRRGSG